MRYLLPLSYPGYRPQSYYPCFRERYATCTMLCSALVLLFLYFHLFMSFMFDLNFSIVGTNGGVHSERQDPGGGC